MKEQVIRKMARAAGWMLIFAFIISPAFAQTFTEQNLRDAILARKTFSNTELQAMDFNKDGRLDTADLVNCIKNGNCNQTAPVSIVGEHVGIMLRDGGKLIEGQTGIYGQMPLALNITSESPLKGEIDNRPDSQLGHYSLYFPNELIPVTFLGDVKNFTIEFKTASSNLAPDSELTRTITFTGDFLDSDKRILGGTYEETVAGFKDNQGNDIPVKMTGKFTLVF